MERKIINNLPCLVTGKGDKTLLFLHGFLSDKESFIRQLKFFEKNCRCVAVDMSGFGENGDIDRIFTLDTYAYEIANLITELGGKVTVIGHSFGGRVAIKLATRYPEKINKLVLVDSAGLKPKRSIRYYVKKTCYKLTKPFLSQSVSEKKFFSSDYNKLSRNMKKSFKLIVNEHLDNLLKDIRLPTLIIYGEKDRETPLYMAKRFHNGIKGSELYVIKNAGHFCFIDNCTEFNYILNEFVWD